MVFQTPHIPFPEGAKVCDADCYDACRLYLHASRTRWSGGAIRGRESDLWLQRVAGLPPERLVLILSQAGFTGVCVDRFGYADHGAEIERELARVLGKSPVPSRDGRLTFFDLRARAAGLKSQYAQSQWERQRKLILQPHPQRAAAPSAVVARDPHTGVWRVAESDAWGLRSFRDFGHWAADHTWRHIRRGDFNGDGAEDIIGLSQQSGQWWLTLRDGTNQNLGAWPGGNQLQDICVGDFDGDGASDLAGRESGNRSCAVALARPGRLVAGTWGKWPATAATKALAGDFNHDGRDDLVALDAAGDAWLGTSDGTSFHWARRHLAFEGKAVTPQAIGDLNGDGRDDVLLLDSLRHELLYLDWAANKPTLRKFSACPAALRDICVGDFDGDGRDDVAGQSNRGEFWVGLNDNSGVSFVLWGRLPDRDKTPALVVRRWSGRKGL